MYQPNAPDPSGTQPVLVVRPPILAKFPLQPISRDRPDTGYPTDARKGDGAGRTFQVFEVATILCLEDGVTCFTLPNQVFDLWLDHGAELGSPLDEGTFDGSTYTYFLFENGRIMYDGGETRFACNADGQFIGGSFQVDCTPFMVGP
jgi:hypothetical protein